MKKSTKPKKHKTEQQKSREYVQNYLRAIAKKYKVKLSNLAIKVLVDGSSCHGGDLDWSLPVDGKPGDWMTVKGRLEVGYNGLNVVKISKLKDYLTNNGQYWICEKSENRLVKGEISVCRSVRLLNLASDQFLFHLGFVFSGRWEVENRKLYADGTATVIATGKSKIESHDDTHVVGKDKTSILAHDRCTVDLDDGASVVAGGGVSVRARGYGLIVARAKSNVVSSGYGKVELYDNSTGSFYYKDRVIASGDSIVEVYAYLVKVKGKDRAVIIKRRKCSSCSLERGSRAVCLDLSADPPTLTTAEG